ncbi:MAG: Orotate phosphoribosyltransferase [Alphaproteobacteria bacterium MarineAlpha2_Bin1]|nr:MAG: Orotate phosphoribosyltransferase [Alphaproteobacteria bacterium MarineAlpha2_Bin1]|tara:strand:+ start:353 stop:940 length:588 start_codon:yes stop_codon:yes gene_type:complete
MNNEDILKYFKESGALLEGHFILSSGNHSAMYLQCAKIFMDPKKSEYLCEILANKIKENINLDEVDLILSPAIGGIIIGYEISRKIKKKSMFLERVEGDFNLRRGFEISPGARVLIIEDVITTGKSSNECISYVQKHSGKVKGLACLVDRTNDIAFSKLDVISLLKLNIPIYAPDEIPNDLMEIKPLKPGSRGLK